MYCLFIHRKLLWGLKMKMWCWEPMRHRHSPAGTHPPQSQSPPPRPAKKIPGLDSVQLQTPREGARFYKAPPQPATTSDLPRPLRVHTFHSPRPPGPQPSFLPPSQFPTFRLPGPTTVPNHPSAPPPGLAPGCLPLAPPPQSLYRLIGSCQSPPAISTPDPSCPSPAVLAPRGPTSSPGREEKSEGR